MTRLWDKGGRLDETVLRYTVGEDHLLDARLVEYDVKASIAHAGMLHAAGYLTDEDHAAIVDGLGELAAGHAAAPGLFRWKKKTCIRPWSGALLRASATPAPACTWAVRATTRYWRRCACISRTPRHPCRGPPKRWPKLWTISARTRAECRCPDTRTCSRPCPAA